MTTSTATIAANTVHSMNAAILANLTYSVICTAYRGNYTKALNDDRNIRLKNDACCITNVLGESIITKPIIDVTGVYREEGMLLPSEEASMVLTTNSVHKAKLLVNLACDIFEQECVLVRNDFTGKCCLMNTEGMVCKLGLWTEVTEAEAIKSVAWTIQDGKFYVAK